MDNILEDLVKGFVVAVGATCGVVVTAYVLARVFPQEEVNGEQVIAIKVPSP